MSKQDPFRFSTGVIAYPMLFMLLIWYVFWVELKFDIPLRSFGVRPHTLKGLIGIVMSPFLHSDVDHLYNNTIPLGVLSAALFYFYRPISWKVLGYGILLSGTLTWLIGQSGNHIGASGLIYVLASFIFFKGIFAKNFRLVALSMLVVFLYGSMIWYVFPVDVSISWEGHLSGAITGFVFALIFRNQIAKPPKYAWEKPDYNEEDDPFMKHFDEDGNFIEHIEEEAPEEIEIRYEYKENEKKDSL